MLGEQKKLLAENVAKLGSECSKTLSGASLTKAAQWCALQTVSSALAEWDHLSKTPDSHPESVFVAMLRLAGALGVFSATAGAKHLPDYEHNRLGDSFMAIHKTIGLLLGDIVDDPDYRIITLSPSNGEGDHLIGPEVSLSNWRWSAEIPKDVDLGHANCYLTVGSAIAAKELAEDVPHLMKLAGSISTIERLIGASLPGIELCHKPSTPVGAPGLVGREYFALTGSGELWRELVATRQVLAFVPSRIPSPEMDLVVVFRPENARAEH